MYADDQVMWQGRMAEPVAPRPDVPYPNLWFVPQWRTEQILRSRLADHGVEVELNAGVIAFEPDEDGVTTRLESGQTLRDGVSGRRRRRSQYRAPPTRGAVRRRDQR